MKFLYYPGCTAKSTAKSLEETSIAMLKKLGVELVELEKWYCCGVMPGLADDALMPHVSSVRNLLQAQKMKDEVGTNKLVAICSMCYNVLKLVSARIVSDEEKISRINNFLEEEYRGEIEVLHLLDVLRDYVGLDKLKESVESPLNKLKVACYYGCALVRPKEVAVDDPEDPSIMEEVVRALGGEPVDYPYKTECCGAFHVIDEEAVAAAKKDQIKGYAKKMGAKVMVTVCPLCHFNLSFKAQEEEIPVVYLTELACYALGLKDVLEDGVKKVVEGVVGKR